MVQYVNCTVKERDQDSDADDYWDMSAPFVSNPSAKLIHRVRTLHTHNGIVSPGRLIIDYWCGGRHYCGTDDDLIFEVPNGRIVCERCELMAIAKGELSSSKLAGRHVHVGRMVVKQTCCGGRIIE